MESRKPKNRESDTPQKYSFLVFDDEGQDKQDVKIVDKFLKKKTFLIFDILSQHFYASPLNSGNNSNSNLKSNRVWSVKITSHNQVDPQIQETLESGHSR